MRASLVIPTLNAAKELPALLETVQAQTVEQYRRNREGGVALARNEDLLRGASSTGEGARLAKAVASRLLREGELVELAAFGIDCCARLLGDRAGRKSAKPHQGGRSCAKRAPIDSAARQLESEGESL